MAETIQQRIARLQATAREERGETVKFGEKTSDSTFFGQGTPEESQSLSEQFGATSFEGRDVLPGELSGTTKKLKSGFITAAQKLRKEGVDLTAGGTTGLSLEKFTDSATNKAFFNPDVPAPGIDFGTEGNLRHGEFPTLPDYNPPSGKNVTEVQILRYEANYAKQAAAISQAQTDKIRKGVGAEQERQLGVDAERTAKEKAGKLKGAEAINPEYVRLTSEQKNINRLRQERGEDFIPETIPSIPKPKIGAFDRKSTEKYNQAVNLIESQNATDRAQGQALMKSMPLSMREGYKNWKAQQQQDEEGFGLGGDVIREEEKLIRKNLNMNPDDKLTFTKEGEALINGNTKSEDSLERATIRSNRDKTNDLKKLSDALELKMAAIESYSTFDGKMSKQGADAKAKSKREYDAKVSEVTIAYDENLDDYVRSEKSRDAQVRLKNEKVESPAAQAKRTIDQERLNGATALQREYEAKGQEITFEAAMNEYKAMQSYKAEGSLNKGEIFAQKTEELNAIVASPSFDMDTLYETAMAKFGSSSDAVNYMGKVKGTPKSVITAQKQASQLADGWTPEQIDEDVKLGAIKEIMDRQFEGDDISLSDLNIVDDYRNDKDENDRDVEQLIVRNENRNWSDVEVFTQALLNIEERDEKKKATGADQGVAFTTALNAVESEFGDTGEKEDISKYLFTNFPRLSAGGRTSIINATTQDKPLGATAERAFDSLVSGEYDEDTIFDSEFSQTIVDKAVGAYKEYKESLPEDTYSSTYTPKERTFFEKIADKLRNPLKSEEADNETTTAKKPRMTDAQFEALYRETF